MNKLIALLILMLPFGIMAGLNQVEQNSYTTNNQSGADTYIVSTLGLNGQYLYSNTNSTQVASVTNYVNGTTNNTALTFILATNIQNTLVFSNFVAGQFFVTTISTNTYQSIGGPIVDSLWIKFYGNSGFTIQPQVFITYDLTNFIPIGTAGLLSIPSLNTTNQYVWNTAPFPTYYSTNATGFHIVRRLLCNTWSGGTMTAYLGGNYPSLLSFQVPINSLNYVTSNQLAAAGMITSNQLAQLLPLDGLLVVPYTNIPAQFLGTKVFSPQLGSNYVQQAADSLPNFGADLSQCGGGKLVFVGQNFAPNGISITRTSLNAYTFEAPAYTVGCLITKTNPALYLNNGQSGIPKLFLTLKNLVVSSLDNSPSYLIDEENGVAENYWDHNYFGPWRYMTNAYIFSTWVGLSGSDTHPDLSLRTNNLVIKVSCLDGAKSTYRNNFCNTMAGWYAADDHSHWENNVFGACGNRHTGWTTNSPFWTGANIVIPSATTEMVFNHMQGYDCQALYYQMTSVGSLKGQNVGITSINDKYETDTYSVLHVGTIFEQINPLAILSVHSATVSGTTITDDGAALGVIYTSDITGATTNSVVQTNDTRSLNLTNSANVFAGTFDATTNTMTFGPGMGGQIVSANLTGWPLGLYFFANPNDLIQMTPIPIPLNVINMKTNYVITLTTLSTNANSIVGYIPFWNFYLNNTDVGNTTTIYRTNMLANTIYSWSFPLSISPSWTTSNILTGGIHCGILANATNAVISYNVSVMSF